MLHIYPVSEIALYLRESLEGDTILADLWVSGEASNVSLSQAGHLYFTLKDDLAQLRCVFFRRARLAPPDLRQGEAIIVHGRVSFWEQGGQLQLYADVVQPEGIGPLHLEFERLKAKLEEEGLFEPERKRRIVPYPQRIALVTSPTGAVLHDIVTIIGRRYPLAELLLVPVLVQGDGAAPSIVAAFEALNARQDVDTVVLARGGGSQEDLWPFNEEAVARAIFASRAPVISAIGHETDVTLADYVADLRAATPSAAAALAVPDRVDLLWRLEGSRSALGRTMANLLAARRAQVEEAERWLERALPDLAEQRRRLTEFTERLSLHLHAYLELRRERTASRTAQLAALDPGHTLARGYAVVQHRDTGAVVSRVAQVAAGDALKVTVRDGSFGAEVLPHATQHTG